MNEQRVSNVRADAKKIEDKFIVGYSGRRILFSIIITIVLAAIAINFLMSIHINAANLVHGIATSLFAASLIYFFFAHKIIRLEIDGRNLTFRRGLGRRQHFALDDIAEVSEMKSRRGSPRPDYVDFIKIERKNGKRIVIEDEKRNFESLQLYFQHYLPDRYDSLSQKQRGMRTLIVQHSKLKLVCGCFFVVFFIFSVGFAAHLWSYYGEATDDVIGFAVGGIVMLGVALLPLWPYFSSTKLQVDFEQRKITVLSSLSKERMSFTFEDITQVVCEPGKTRIIARNGREMELRSTQQNYETLISKLNEYLPQFFRQPYG